MRFHLDEHVNPAISAGLRLHGINVTTTADAQLISADDEAHVAFALQEGRVVFTNDADFIRIHRRGVSHAGIVYSQRDKRTIGEVVDYLRLMHECMDEGEMLGRVDFL
jgi:predicted nuclease of predicted toxin-antitoxin system